MKKIQIRQQTMMVFAAVLFTGHSAQAITIATDANFEAEVTQVADTPVVVFFHQEGCVPCNDINPLFGRLAMELQPKIKFVKVDANASPKSTAKNTVQSTPTFIFFKGGKHVGSLKGVQPGTLEERIKNLLKK